jgi:hypothetical protein
MDGTQVRCCLECVVEPEMRVLGLGASLINNVVE